MNLSEIREYVRRTLKLNHSIIGDRELTVYINQAMQYYVGYSEQSIINKIVENLGRYLGLTPHPTLTGGKR